MDTTGSVTCYNCTTRYKVILFYYIYFKLLKVYTARCKSVSVSEPHHLHDIHSFMCTHVFWGTSALLVNLNTCMCVICVIFMMYVWVYYFFKTLNYLQLPVLQYMQCVLVYMYVKLHVQYIVHVFLFAGPFSSVYLVRYDVGMWCRSLWCRCIFYLLLNIYHCL